jgi:hypothetical protein
MFNNGFIANALKCSMPLAAGLFACSAAFAQDYECFAGSVAAEMPTVNESVSVRVPEIELSYFKKIVFSADGNGQLSVSAKAHAITEVDDEFQLHQVIAPLNHRNDSLTATNSEENPIIMQTSERYVVHKGKPLVLNTKGKYYSLLQRLHMYLMGSYGKLKDEYDSILKTTHSSATFGTELQNKNIEINLTKNQKQKMEDLCKRMEVIVADCQNLEKLDQNTWSSKAVMTIVSTKIKEDTYLAKLSVDTQQEKKAVLIVDPKIAFDSKVNSYMIKAHVTYIEFSPAIWQFVIGTN